MVVEKLYMNHSIKYYYDVTYPWSATTSAERLVRGILAEYFDGRTYSDVDSMVSEAKSVLTYAPHYTNSGWCACYYSDIREACIGAGYSARHTDEYFVKRYDEALGYIARFIAFSLEKVVCCF